MPRFCVFHHVCLCILFANIFLSSGGNTVVGFAYALHRECRRSHFEPFAEIVFCIIDGMMKKGIVLPISVMQSSCTPMSIWVIHLD